MPILTLDLPPAVAAQLQSIADRQGLTLADYAQETLAEVALLANLENGGSQADEGLAAMLDRWDEEDAARGGEPTPPPVIPRLALRRVDLG